MAGPVDEWRSSLSMVRRWKLEDAAARWVAATTGKVPQLDHGAFADAHWAGGLPFRVAGMPYAVLRPYPPAADWAGLAGLVILTATLAEPLWTIDHAPKDTRVIDLSSLL